MRRRLGALLAVPSGRDARIFAVASVVDALGNSMFLPISALFFVKVAGLPVGRVGLGLSIAGGVGMLGPLLAGPPVDRYGPRRVVVSLYVVLAAVFTVLPWVRGFAPFVAIAVAVYVFGHMSRPALQALAASLTDESERVTTLAFVRSVRNVGWGIGALLVALALATDRPGALVALVLADAVSFAVAAVLLARVREVRAPVAQDAPRGSYGAVLRDRRFVALGALRGIVTLHLSVLLFGFPLWVDQRTNAPTAIVGVVFAVNSLLVVLFQVPVSRRSPDVAGGGRALRRSGFALLATCVLLATTQGVPRWPAVVLLLLIGLVECAAELEESAGGWAVSLGLAPAHARGRYLGVWEAGHVFHDVGGPLIMAFIVESAGPAGWLVLGAVVAVAGVAASRLADGAQPVA